MLRVGSVGSIPGAVGELWLERRAIAPGSSFSSSNEGGGLRRRGEPSQPGCMGVSSLGLAPLCDLVFHIQCLCWCLLCEMVKRCSSGVGTVKGLAFRSWEGGGVSAGQ